MKTRIFALIALSACSSASALAAQLDTSSLERVATCTTEDATFRVYGPTDSGLSIAESIKAYTAAVNGQISRDLSVDGKGDGLEPVRLAFDGGSLTVRSLDRDLPTARIPLAGGKVTFDHRFGENMDCIIGSPNTDN